MYGEEGEVLTEIVKNRTSTSVDWAEANSLSYNYEYTNDSKKMLTGMSVADLTENYTYDSLQRDKSIVQTLGENTYKKEYGYYKVGDHTTGLINVEKTYQNGMTKDKITYTYDCMGNITKIVKNGIVLKEYKYDSSH